MEILFKCLHPVVLDDGRVFGCGVCAHCRRLKYTEWSVRCRHEMMYTTGACFFTLTYSNKTLPVDKRIIKECPDDMQGTLNYRHTTLFLKRLRKHFPPGSIRYVYCGEYGPLSWRPHYHFILFGVDFLTPGLKKLLSDCWRLGHVDLSKKPVTEHAIQYTLGYVRKKIDGRLSTPHYYANYRVPPQQRQSQGLGRIWCDRNVDTWSRSLLVGYNGHQVPIPRYYIKRLYKSEGLTVKENVHNLATGKSHISYKVIPDYSKQYSGRIINVMAVNMVKRFERLKTLYVDVIPGRLIRSFIQATSDFFISTVERNIDCYRDLSLILSVYPDYVINRTIRHDTARARYRDDLSYLTKRYGDLGRKMFDSARQKELEIRRGRYGQRDVYESAIRAFGVA